MTMTPDEVVKELKERLSLAEIQRAEYSYRNKEVDKFIKILTSASSLIQDYQKLRERVSVEVLRGIIRMNPTYYGISEKEFTKSIDKLADKIITYLQQPTEH